MIEHRIHIRWKYRMIMVIDYYCRIGPPQKKSEGKTYDYKSSLLFLYKLCPDKSVKSLHTFGAEHSLHFIAPYCLTAIRIFLYQKISRQKSRRTVMLRPVKIRCLQKSKVLSIPPMPVSLLGCNKQNDVFSPYHKPCVYDHPAREVSSP